MKKGVIAVIVVAVIAATAYCSYLCGVESQRGAITQLTNELEGVERDKSPIDIILERERPKTLDEKYSLY